MSLQFDHRPGSLSNLPPLPGLPNTEVVPSSWSSLLDRSLQSGEPSESQLAAVKEEIVGQVLEGRVASLMINLSGRHALQELIAQEGFAQDLFDLLIFRRNQIASAIDSGLEQSGTPSSLREVTWKDNVLKSSTNVYGFKLDKEDQPDQELGRVLGRLVFDAQLSFKHCCPQEFMLLLDYFDLSEEYLLDNIEREGFLDCLKEGLNTVVFGRFAEFIKFRLGLIELPEIASVVEQKLAEQLIDRKSGGRAGFAAQKGLVASISRGENSKRDLVVLLHALELYNDFFSNSALLKGAAELWLRDCNQEVKVLSDGDQLLLETFLEFGLFDRDLSKPSDPLVDVRNIYHSVFNSYLLTEKGLNILGKLQFRYNYSWEALKDVGLEKSINRTLNKLSQLEDSKPYFKFCRAFNVPSYNSHFIGVLRYTWTGLKLFSRSFLGQ